jgi:hypothetical protein
MISTTTNSGLAKGGLTCFVETFVQNSTFVLRMNFITINPSPSPSRQTLAVIVKRHRTKIDNGLKSENIRAKY